MTRYLATPYNSCVMCPFLDLVEDRAEILCSHTGTKITVQGELSNTIPIPDNCPLPTSLESLATSILKDLKDQRSKSLVELSRRKAGVVV